ncbi:MAG: hypothetical protein OEV76_06980, partial [Anaerolineae bacterium]|nr:hypothetical protein [Anaerolineae bacterium]
PWRWGNPVWVATGEGDGLAQATSNKARTAISGRIALLISWREASFANMRPIIHNPDPLVNILPETEGGGCSA